MYNYEIYPLHVCTFLKKVKAGKEFPEVPDKTVESPVLAYLIKADGENIVVDTGACEADWSAKYHHEMYYPDEMRIENRLRALGVEPDDVKIVVNTHLHWDHCYGNHLFKNAKIYVQAKELAQAVNPTPGHYLYYEAFQMGLTPPWLNACGQFEVVDGDYELMPGIKLILLPGHTPGFQCVQVQTASGRYLIASDFIPNMSYWNNRKYGLPVASEINTCLTEYYDSLKKALTLADYVLPGHDFAAMDKEVYK